MRAPVGSPPPSVVQMASTAVSLAVEVWEQQPVEGSTPRGMLAAVSGTFTDDASQATQRRMTLNLTERPGWLYAGMWVRASVGVNRLIYALPTMCVTEIQENLGELGGASLAAGDPSSVLNGRPYEADTTLFPYSQGTNNDLRRLVGLTCEYCLPRPTDVSGVPLLSIPFGMTAEFGSGRWDACLKA